MLILPLHRPFNRANFPFATIALVLVNAFVFFFLQSQDGAAGERALRYYQQAQLGRVQLPVYRDWRVLHPDPRRPQATADGGGDRSRSSWPPSPRYSGSQ